MTTTVRYQGISNTSAVCRGAALWHINAATREQESFYPRMAARLFIIFRAEGIINELGRILDENWKKTERNKKLLDKHIFVCSTIGLSTCGEQFVSAHKLIEKLNDFRNELAHPKLVPFDEEISSTTLDRLSLPPTMHWQKMMEEHTEEAEYRQLEDYLWNLLKTAQNWLEKNAPYERRRHFPDVRGLYGMEILGSTSPI